MATLKQFLGPTPARKSPGKRKAVRAPLDADKVREDVLALLRANPQLAPRDDAERAAMAEPIYTPTKPKTVTGGRPRDRGRPAKTTHGGFPAAIAP